MNIQFAAAKALGAHIEAQIAELDGKVVIQHPDPDKHAVFPSLSIGHNTFRRVWHVPEDVLFDGVAKTLVRKIGDLVGDFELRVYASDAPMRERLENAVEALFQTEDGAPGRLVLTLPNIEIGGVASGYTAVISFDFDDGSSWQEEMVFAKQRFSYLDIDVGLPILVRRTAVDEMTSLRLALTQDTVSEQPVVEEVVEVQEDGSTKPSS